MRERAAVHRVDNEMQIFQYAVARGWLPSRAAAENPDPFVRKLLNRIGLGRKILRWNFNR